MVVFIGRPLGGPWSPHWPVRCLLRVRSAFFVIHGTAGPFGLNTETYEDVHELRLPRRIRGPDRCGGCGMYPPFDGMHGPQVSRHFADISRWAGHGVVILGTLWVAVVPLGGADVVWTLPTFGRIQARPDLVMTAVGGAALIAPLVASDGAVSSRRRELARRRPLPKTYVGGGVCRPPVHARG
jgi:hypothetical protein